MGRVSPSHFNLTASSARELIAGINPVAHGITRKTFLNLRSNFNAALKRADIVDGKVRGRASRDPAWAPLVRAAKADKSISYGLGSFFSFCASRHVLPEEVNDQGVLEYLRWLEHRSIAEKPLHSARRVPLLWNKAVQKFDEWPQNTLSKLTLGLPPKKRTWEQLPPSLKADADKYIAMRANPDVFDEHPWAPPGPLSPDSILSQKSHLRLSADCVLEAGVPVAELQTLADLVKPENVKIVLRYYMGDDVTKPSRSAATIAKTLLAVARMHVRVSDDQNTQLKKIVGRLPSIPNDLTEKNKALLRLFDSDDLLGRMFELPDVLMDQALGRLKAGERYFHVPAQAGLGIAILLRAPMRIKNAASLNWRRHFHQPNG
jgi:hypothetical protein